MVKSLFLFILLLSSIAHGQTCPQDDGVESLMSPCQKAYYKYAPSCSFKDVSCLSLALQGLVNKNLFDYRSELRSRYNTPLKRKRYRQTAEYQSHYRAMLRDLDSLKDATFCSEMSSYWLYDLNFKGFLFSPNAIIPKGRLFKLDNVERISAGYDLVEVDESVAVDIEAWETVANEKYVFFKVAGNRKGFVGVEITQYVWLLPNITFDHEGTAQIEHEGECQDPSFYIYKAGR